VGVIKRLVADTNAIVDLLRDDRTAPAALTTAGRVFLPLPAVGELFAGAHHSHRVVENLGRVAELLERWNVLSPDIATARVYGELRGTAGKTRITAARMNDLWIAALCIQHSLPLLTNDAGFDAIAGLTVLHW
jgi:tRNA(fMet)-specific endonuclease VapC